jgi:hypothetical protein
MSKWKGKRAPKGHLYRGDMEELEYSEELKAPAAEPDPGRSSSVAPPAAPAAAEPAPRPVAEPAQVAPVAAVPAVAAVPVASAITLAEPLVIGNPPMRGSEPKLTGAVSPYRPDTVVDGGAAFGIVARACSVRGRDKRDGGGPRQDDLCLSVVEARQAIVVAIADGMGSATRAHLGAALATRHAIEEVERQLADVPPSRLDWEALFKRAAQALVVAHRDSRGGSDDHTPKEVSRDLGTTLTVAVAWIEGGRTQFEVAARGDSPAWMLDGDRWDMLLGEMETDETFEDSTVVALPYLVGRAQHACGTLLPGQVLVLASDGFGRPLGDGRNDLGLTFARALRTPPPLVAWGQLVDFGRRTYSDDRTIAALWPAPAS